MRKRLGLLMTFLGLLVLIVSGCAKPEQKCLSPEDNPQHHYLRGMEFLEQSKIEDATAKFDRALYCKHTFGPAHSGLAIVMALKAGAKADAGYRAADVKSSLDHLKLAYKFSKTPEEQFAYRVATIRTYTELKIEKWLSESEDHYNEAMKLKVDDRKLLYYDGSEAATYFIGRAYLAGREFQKARDKFSEVLNAKVDSKWHGPADRDWKKTDKIVRALSGITVGDVGKEIAIKDSVKRGDMAALLADELKVDKLFAGRIPLKSDIDKKADFVPADILNHQFRQEILIMMKWGIRGLEPVYDPTTKANLFKPEDPVTRKELALFLEDVLMKLLPDEKLATAFFGHDKSPFPDVNPTSAWYNAIMNMTTRSIMESEISGEFRPDDKVDGAEAILAIRVLRQRINIH